MLTFLYKTNLGRGLTLVAVSAAVLLGWLQPTWAVDPARHGTAWMLLSFGLGLPVVLAWILVVLVLLKWRPGLLFRGWRCVIGGATIIISALGVLAYFTGELPLVGEENLGGTYGMRVQGGNELLGYVRIIGLSLLGLWLLAPRRVVGMAVLRFMYSTGLLVRGAFLAANYVKRTARAGLGLRRLRTAPPGDASGRGATNLGDEVADYLAASGPSYLPPHMSRLEREPELPSPASAPHPAPKVLEDGDHLQSSAQMQVSSSETGWRLPSLNHLEQGLPTTGVTEEHQATARLIEEALAQHAVEVQVAEIRPGPAVTLFGLVPGWSSSRSRGQPDEAIDLRARKRVKVDSILAREKDLALALAAPSLRLQAPVPGESVVGVEVPNRMPVSVAIRSVMESEPYVNVLRQGGLPVALGQASDGEAVVIDLLRMPHLLIGGATGSGKSVCMNSVVSSLIMHHQPTDLRLLLVDPKRVELTPYNGIPHLITPVVVDTDKVTLLLKGVIEEMLRRYRLLEEAGVRNVQSYNRSPRASASLPYLVVCVDELADLMMTSAFDVESSLCRLAQLGRATGIHLVVATQRPSVDVVTGLIKANFPSRISFAVPSQVDSRTILDTAGAERLIGRGDMLFLSADAPRPRRVQGVYISEEEAEALAEHWRQAIGPPPADIPLELLARDAALGAEESGLPPSEQDTLFDKAVALAAHHRQLSTSLLQRRLGIGYPRAARLMDQLEEEGIVAPSTQPSKAREVLYRPE